MYPGAGLDVSEKTLLHALNIIHIPYVKCAELITPIKCTYNTTILSIIILRNIQSHCVMIKQIHSRSQVAQLVDALSHKTESYGFDSRWGPWKF